jgi:predicted aldo/keto reductase-like oxidoreductase
MTPSDHNPTADNRRAFLARAGAGAAALSLASCRQHPPAAPATKTVEPTKAADGLQTRTLGRTGLNVVVVGIGCADLSNGPAPVRRAIDQGLNYLDTADTYLEGHGEEHVGRAIEGLRDKVIVATKWVARAQHKQADLLAMLDASLKRLKVDHVDIMQIHGLGDQGFGGDAYARLDNPELAAAMAAAKKAGKARFFGATSHDGQRAAILRHAIDQGHYDMILVKLSHGDFDPAMADLLAHARAKSVGVVAMKSTQGNHAPPELKESDPFKAQLKWALGQGVACVINSGVGSNTNIQNKALEVAREPLELSAAELRLVADYTRLVGAEWCRGCGHVCGAACPAGVRIADVLRYRMYAKGYGAVEMARAEYRQVDPEQRLTAACGDCTRCVEACPHGLPVIEHLEEARRLLA